MLGGSLQSIQGRVGGGEQVAVAAGAGIEGGLILGA